MNGNAPIYFIRTYGCQANTADSSYISDILNRNKFVELELPNELSVSTEEGCREKELLTYALEHSNLFIINSCCVRQKSEDKVYGIGKIVKDLKQKNKHIPLIILTGCMVGSTKGERKRIDAKELEGKTDWVDIYLDHESVAMLPELIKSKGLYSGMLNVKNPSGKNKRSHSYINISTGCDNFCSYCVVPYSRGKEVSRDEREIINEIVKLTKDGVTDFTLCGQNVNSWGLNYDEKFKIRAGSSEHVPFVDLLKKIHSIPEVKKIDFISSNPFDFTIDLVKTLGMPKISNYLHIAVQSGSNEILKKMNRRHTVKDFLSLISEIKKIRPDMELGTDIIVGFPGETEKQFMETVDLFKKIKFNVAFISKYSPRKGTFAYKNYPDDVPREEKSRRLSYLTKIWKDSL
ncbi:MAG TPA: MiaB/RimO family radical SAM methylthiotransferase [bacterium]|nr:MiaB/RimO family radical SAM methylthiotransferase [bacterium]